MSRCRTAIAAAILITAALPAAAKPLCYTPTEVRAMQFRQLQVELMVAALKCRQVDPAVRDKYAAYVGKIGPNLNQNASELKSMFVRLGKGAGHVDRYMTELSNQASMNSQHIENYCETQDAVFSKVLSMRPHEIEAFAADTVEKPYSPASCQGPAVKQASAKEKPAAKAAPKKAEAKG
ncbi:MAG: heme utilization protein [Solirubrobacterales bacterium]